MTTRKYHTTIPSKFYVSVKEEKILLDGYKFIILFILLFTGVLLKIGCINNEAKDYNEQFKTEIHNMIMMDIQREKVSMITTAYSEFDSCHYEGCKMASGKPAYVGAIACPRDWELGKQVIIDGITYTCEDRYNLNLEDRIDIFMGYGKDSYIKAINYGKQIKTVIHK